MRTGLQLAFGAMLVLATLGSTPLTVTLNEKPLVATALVRNGRVLLPLRAIFGALNAIVEYDAVQHAVHAQRGGDRIFIKIGTHNSVVVADRLFVPVRYISESLGGKVRYDAVDHIVFITDPRADFKVTQVPRVIATDGPVAATATFSPPPIAYATPDQSAPYYSQALNFFIPSDRRTYYPGDPLQFMLTAPPGGQAYLQLCNYGQLAFINPLGSSQYIVNLTVPRRLAGHVCTATASYIGPLGARRAITLPFEIAFAQTPTPAPTPTPTVTPRPTPRPTPTPVATRIIEPPGLRHQPPGVGKRAS